MIESRVRDASPRVLSVKFCRSTRGSEEGGAVQRASRQCPRTTGCILLSGLHQRGFAPSVSSTGDDVRPMALLCWHTIVMALPLGALS